MTSVEVAATGRAESPRADFPADPALGASAGAAVTRQSSGVI
jgi:hypothetical protein